jgi:UDP-4-amino-4,6-dideoxy-N-acetyl-beta-L-altrosamine N-acetyltransferase
MEKNMLRTIPYQYLDAEKKTLVLQWRNDDRIRRYMKNTAVIPYSTHSEFIENLKVNNNKHYFLVLDDELCIGTINLNKIDRYTAEGGLLKNPDLKEPVGTKLISCLEREAVKHNYSAILLEVQKSNLKAQQLYEKAGYRKTDETETYNIYKNCRVICESQSES